MRWVFVPLVLSVLPAAVLAQGQGMFTGPQPLNLGGDAHSFALAEDELYMVLATNRAGGGYDLWETRRSAIGSSWIPPSWLNWPLPTPVPGLNDPAADDYDPELSPDGLELYFASTRAGPGPTNLWVSRRPAPMAPWGLPVLVPGAVNQPVVHSRAPRLTEDGLTMYFTANASGSGTDIYTVSRADNQPGTPWTNPQPFAPANDPVASDDSPLPLANGDVVFFASDRAGSASSDIWMTWRTGPAGHGPPVRVTDLSTIDWDGYGELGRSTGALYTAVHVLAQPSIVWIRCPVPAPIDVNSFTYELIAQPQGLLAAPYLVWTRRVPMAIPTSPLLVTIEIADWRCPPPASGLLLASFALQVPVQPFPVPGLSGVLALSGPVTLASFGIPPSGTAAFPLVIPPNPILFGLDVFFQYVAVAQFAPLDANFSQVLWIDF